jgi:hypothetical protein
VSTLLPEHQPLDHPRHLSHAQDPVAWQRRAAQQKRHQIGIAHGRIAVGAADQKSVLSDAAAARFQEEFEGIVAGFAMDIDAMFERERVFAASDTAAICGAALNQCSNCRRWRMERSAASAGRSAQL